MEYKVKERRLTITLPKRIDATSAVGAAKELNDICSSLSHDEVVLDASDLNYISSSGLRALQTLAKLEDELTMTNVNEEILDIINATGFTNIMKVEKALRHIVLNEDQLIGKGIFGAVYRISDNEIVKVNLMDVSRNALQKEINNFQEAFRNGIPAAICHEIVDCGEGRLGITFEAEKCDTLNSYITKHPEELNDLVDKYIALLKAIHNNHSTPLHLPEAKQMLFARLEMKRGKSLTDEQVDAFCKIIDTIPDGDSLVQGDCNPKNILIINGELKFIDISDISIGHPLLDLMMFFFVENSWRFSLPDKLSYRITGLTRETSNLISNAVIMKYMGYDEHNLLWLNSVLEDMMVIARTAVITKPLTASIPEDWKERISRVADKSPNGRFHSLIADIKKWANDFQ